MLQIDQVEASTVEHMAKRFNAVAISALNKSTFPDFLHRASKLIARNCTSTGYINEK